MGDGLSRNPPDRDKVRDADADKARLPITLGEAFDLISKAQYRGGLEVDDSEEYTQQFAVMSNTSSSHIPVSDDDYLLTSNPVSKGALPSILTYHQAALTARDIGVVDKQDFVLSCPSRGGSSTCYV